MSEKPIETQDMAQLNNRQNVRVDPRTRAGVWLMSLDDQITDAVRDVRAIADGLESALVATRESLNVGRAVVRVAGLAGHELDMAAARLDQLNKDIDTCARVAAEQGSAHITTT